MYMPDPPATPSCTVLSPHSDDAALSLSGTLRWLAARGETLEVLTCFSMSAFAGNASVHGAEAVTRLRREEDRAFVRMVDARCAAAWLDFPDAPLRGVPYDALFSSQELTEEGQHLAATLAASLQARLDPSCALFVPLGFGSHIDHLIVRSAGLQLLERGFSRVFLYEDLPYAALYPLPALNAVVSRTAGRLGIDLTPRRISIPQLGGFKAAALDCYPSQVSHDWIDGVLAHARKFATDGGEAEQIWQVNLRQGVRSPF